MSSKALANLVLLGLPFFLLLQACVPAREFKALDEKYQGLKDHVAALEFTNDTLNNALKETRATNATLLARWQNIQHYSDSLAADLRQLQESNTRLRNDYTDLESLHKGLMAGNQREMGRLLAEIQKNQSQLQGPTSIAQKIRQLLSGIKEGIFSIVHLKKKWQFVAHSLFIWIMYFLMFYIVFFSMEETKNLSLLQVLTAFVIGSFAIVFTNGGLGAYPLFIAKVLLLFGVAQTVGTALGWVIWIAQFLMIILFGGFSFLLLPILNKRNR